LDELLLLINLIGATRVKGARYSHASQAQSDHIWSSVKHDPAKSTVKKVCQTLAEERKRQGVSQQRLSEMAGISRTGLRHIESLETNPTLYSLLRIAKALDVDLADLL
jgi:putative transcriptional regulator